RHHRGVPYRRVVCVGHRVRTGAVLRLPLLGTGRTFGELPLVPEKGFEEAVVPGDRGGRPRALQPAGDRVLALAAAEGVLPAQPLALQVGALGLGTHVRGGRRTV